MSLRKKIMWISLVLLAIGIKIFSLFPAAVEKYYSRGFYPLISGLQRALFGWIPFSIGDIAYGLLIGWLLVGIVKMIRKMIKRQADWPYFLVRRIVSAGLIIYVLFNLLWGLNYERKGIADQLNLEVRPYSTAELVQLVSRITDKLNALDSLSQINRDALRTKRNLYAGAIHSYALLAEKDPRFAYPRPSVKASFFSYLGNYLGFGGYYNPFSGEAQVNTTLPVFLQPYTACHEIGHQLGYAKENEANFAGYLSAHSSADPAFQYSVYFDMYLYGARELYVRDSNLVRPFREQLKPAIRQDYRELQKFYRKYENPLEPVIQKLYSGFLKANGQPQGIMTYEEVVAWLIAYARKNGWDAL